METIKPVYVADTNALFWYLKHDSKLSAQATRIFQAAERGETRIIISAVVVAELHYLNKKHKVFADFAKVYEDLKSKPYFQLVVLDPDEILDFDKDAAVTEIHDRIIAGLARRLDAPLITIDPQITATGLVEIVW